MRRSNWTKKLQAQHSFDLYESTQNFSEAFKIPCYFIEYRYQVCGDIDFELFCFESWGMDREQITAKDCSLVANYLRKFDFDKGKESSFYSLLKAARCRKYR